MKVLIVLLSVLMTSTFAAETLRSEKIKEAIAEEVESSSYKWDTTYSVGEIWVEGYGLGSDWLFEITNWKSSEHMVVQAYFSCGSEYDESSFHGSCEVHVLKDGTQWVPIIENFNHCECEVTSYE